MLWITSKRLFWLAVTLVYLGLIFFVSSRPYLVAPGPQFDMKDKLAHLVEYMILGALLWKCGTGAMVRDRLVAVFVVLAVGASLAAADELFQGTVPGRLTTASDWVADVIGVAVGASVLAWRERAAQRREAVR